MGVNGIYGLSGSGLDIESMVKVGMMSKQNQLDKMQQKVDLATWKKESMTNVYSDLSTYNYSTLTQYKLQSNMNAMSAASSDESSVKVSANGEASAMTHRVAVNSLSSNAYLMTEDSITRQNTNAPSSLYLSDNIFAADASERTSYTADDVAVSFTLLDGTEDYTGMTNEEIDEYKEARTISYTYADLFGSQKTYNDLASDINALGLNIKASYDATNDSFSLYNSESGSDNKIALTMNTDHAATLFNNLGLKQSKDGELLGPKISDSEYAETTYTFSSGAETSVAGSNGSITIDGKTYNNVENNRITVSGVTYNLQDVTEIGTTINVVVSQDTDSIIDKVKSFVEDYNKMLDGLYDKYSETKYTDYKPLTSSQKEKMTEEQIEKWEEKAKSGLLYHDSTLRGIIDKMRSALATPVDGLNSKYNSAYSLGIDTSKTNGHITLDEDKLKKALAEDSEAAYKVFGTLPEADENGKYDFNSMGVAQRLGDVMTDSMKLVKTEAGETTETSDGSNLGNKILELQTKMSDFKTRMSAYETQLYAKYDAMETMLATLGAQMNFISGG